MTLLFTAIAFIVIFSVLILVHEWGHFIIARKNGIKVEEFGFGLPPRIWGVKKGETLYSINAIPFGGFVRLFGEDMRDVKSRRSSRSFAAKSARVRILVVIGGVLMNFLLALLLLTIGFIFGIQPLIISGQDVIAKIEDGTIHTQVGIMVKDVKEDSPAARGGLRPNDILQLVNGGEISDPGYLDKIIHGKAAAPTTGGLTAVATPPGFQILRDGQVLNLQIASVKGQDLGFAAYEFITLPRLQVFDLPKESPYYLAGIRTGDTLLSINEKNVYSLSDFQDVLDEAENLKIAVLRGNSFQNFELHVPLAQRTVIANILPDSPAKKAGFQVGDLILGLNGQKISLPAQMVDLTRKSVAKAPGAVGESAAAPLHAIILRSGQLREIAVTPNQDGLIGVGLEELWHWQNMQLSFLSRNLPLSVTKIEDAKYPFWIAPVKALEESVRLSALTLDMFGNIVRSLVTRLTIPEGVAGPVGIWQLTSTFVQQGFLSLLRFMALLSLSLALINILPFPALDGGRLFFILVEVVIGKRLNPRHEALIHTIGFVLLMLLILAVTYSDILRIF